MLVTQLTVVNACLASMGEEPLNSLAEENAFVNSAKFALENANADVQSEGWWFNKEVVELIPDSLGEYPVSADIIDLDIGGTNPKWLAVRQGRLYDTSKGKRLIGTRTYHANITRLLDFEDVPFHGKRLIKASAVILFQQAYDGDAQKIKDAQEEYRLAYILAKSQHIRSVGANFGTKAARFALMQGGTLRLRTPR